MVLPDASLLTSASQTWVVRPPCSKRASQLTPPDSAVPRKLVFSSIVVKPAAPSGNDTMQPYPHAVSARATTVAACKYPFGARCCLSTTKRPRAKPCRSSVQSRPRMPGRNPLCFARKIAGASSMARPKYPTPSLLPDQQHRIRTFRNPLPGVGIVLFEAPILPARRKHNQFALVHAPGRRSKANHGGVAAGLDLDRHGIGTGGRQRQRKHADRLAGTARNPPIANHVFRRPDRRSGRALQHEPALYWVEAVVNTVLRLAEFNRRLASAIEQPQTAVIVDRPSDEIVCRRKNRRTVFVDIEFVAVSNLIGSEN